MGLNDICVPMWQLDSDGSVLPNLLFHRPWDKLHSRCIEYPFAASQVGNPNRVLDVGTAKADEAWIKWLSDLPCEVHATDYDPPNSEIDGFFFHQCDVRDIDLPDNSVDVVLAVSVIEHIGLDSPQVNRVDLPSSDLNGDVEAVGELARVLKPGGKLIMTFPFGEEDRLILNGSARCYSLKSLQRFERYIRPSQLDYYEYQYRRFQSLYVEHAHEDAPIADLSTQIPEEMLPNLMGAVTWRKLSLNEASASQFGHVDGVLCGVWIKE